MSNKPFKPHGTTGLSNTDIHAPRFLAHNVLWNLGGLLLPLIVAVFTMPRLIHGMGADRFGILTLAWVVIGYFSLFDLGIGRAVTKLVSEKLGEERYEEIPVLFWTAIVLMGILGIIGALALATLAPWLVSNVLKVPHPLEPETIKTFYLLAGSLPIVISTAGLRGLLEAHQQFRAINMLRMVLGIATYVAPFLMLSFTKNLFPITAVLVLARLLIWFGHLWLCLRCVPTLRRKVSFSTSLVGTLLRFGGWMTVSNIISPMMVYFDRFIIAATISTAAVAYYTTPYEVVTKLLVFPAALSGVLFPAFAASFLIDQLRCKNLYDRGIKYISITLFPVTLIIVAFAHEGLSWWVGPVFAEQGAFVLKCLAAGVYMNALAYMPFALIQGAGRPDLTAKVHFIELPIYLFTLWTLTNSLGIKGAAIAWTLRVSMDAVVMLRIATYLFKQKDKATHQHAAVIGTGLAILALAASLDGVLLKSTLLIIVLLGFTAIVWFLMLSENEKRFTRESGKKLLARCST